jgi:acyl-[acyl-carrier-protein]-phospholipid O-acyltransferase/long-chain-fatty-acid--[acyl-carrier-protein] ligase
MWQPLYENKWLQPICRLFKAIPLAQGSPKEALRALRNARTELEQGHLVCIFPEGELTTTSHVKPFERGVEAIRRGQESTPVIPVYLDGLWGHPLSRRGGGSWRAWLTALRKPVTVFVGEPITGKISAEQMYQRVLELGTAAAEHRKAEDMTLAMQFIRAAKRNWRRTAIADSTGKQLTYGETLTAALLLKRRVAAACEGSANIGLLLPSSAGGALANIAVTLAGKTAVNLNFTAGEEAMRHAVAACGITTIISSRAFLEKVKLPELPGLLFLEDVLPLFTAMDKAMAWASARWLRARRLAERTSPGDIAAIIFSSGSTGTPKGVMLSHWNLISNAEATGDVYSVGREDCMLGVLPLFHSFGYTYGLWFPLLHGFKAVFHANPTDAKTIGELAAAHRPTLFLSTPTFCMSYLRKCTREQFASIRHLLVGAERLRPKLAAAFQERFGITLVEGYGCTEMGPAVSVNVNDDRKTGFKAGSVGRPLPRISFRIVDPETFAPLAAGQTGLLLVNGPSRMIGYLHDAERTAQAMHDGYYATGDLAFVDEDGFLHIGDRLSRFSKIGGEMVPHLKIEETIDELLHGRSSAVTGIPDEQRGERLAVLYTQADVTPAALWHRLNETSLPKLWVPKQENIYLVEAIPVLGTGKVDLRGVKRMAQELAAGRKPGASTGEALVGAPEDLSAN